MSKRVPINRILWYEGIGFLLILICLWLPEIPLVAARLGLHENFGWWLTSLLSAVVLLAGIAVMLMTARMVSRLRALEEIFISCAWCKKIEHNREWLPIDEFFQEKFKNVTSHGICMACLGEVEKGIAKRAAG
jgi:hypothetical protein